MSMLAERQILVGIMIMIMYEAQSLVVMFIMRKQYRQIIELIKIG